MNTSSYESYVNAARDGFDRARRFGFETYERLRAAGPWQLAAALVVALVLLALVVPLLVTAAFVIFLLVLIALWVREFLALMRHPDSDFPGRFDKLVWSIVMIVLPPIGLIAFGIFRRRHWPEEVDDSTPLWPTPPPPKSDEPWDRDVY